MPFRWLFSSQYLILTFQQYIRLFCCQRIITIIIIIIKRFNIFKNELPWISIVRYIFRIIEPDHIKEWRRLFVYLPRFLLNSNHLNRKQMEMQILNTTRDEPLQFVQLLFCFSLEFIINNWKMGFHINDCSASLRWCRMPMHQCSFMTWILTVKKWI